MIIIQGVQHKAQPLGLVADWCRRCRCIRPVMVVRQTKYTHVYYVRVGREENLGDDLTCTFCEATWAVPRAEHAAFVDPAEGVELDDLIDLTNPGLREACRARTAREVRLMAGEGTPADRDAALDEAFEHAAEQCEVITMRGAMGVADTLAFFGIIAVGVVVVAVLMRPRFGTTWIDWVLAGVAGSAVIPLAWVMATQRHRQCRRRVLPALGESIWMLAPTREQVRARLEEARDRRRFIARAFRADDVLAAAVKCAERWERRSRRAQPEGGRSRRQSR